MPKAQQTIEYLSSLRKEDFEKIVRNLNYLPDRANWESFRAPWIVLNLNAGDCDDLALLVAFWARANKIKWQWQLYGRNNIIKHIATLTKSKEGLILWDVFGDITFERLFVDQWRK